MRKARNRNVQQYIQVKSRDAFSLLEMLLALAILGGSLAILGQIAETGVDAARQARDLSMARLIAQSKLSEVLINVSLEQTPQSVFDTPVDPIDSLTTTAYTYSVEVQPATLDGMLMIRILVTATDANGNVSVNYALDRWIIDPAIGLAELEMEEEAAKEEAKESSSAGAVP